MVNENTIAHFIEERKCPQRERINQFNENDDLGFNAFSLMSDIYHRENFHSDIIKSIMDVNGRHEAGNKYLFKFISLINRSINQSIIEELYFDDVKVTREQGRRDITIVGKNKHSIIIENKINDAADTHNQIPNYVKQLEDTGHTIDAIVYLTLNQAKEPNEETWQLSAIKKVEIKSKLVSIRAYDGTIKDLCTGWLKECIDITTQIDTLSIIRQYYKLIKHLTRSHMNHEFFKELDFYLKSRPENADIVLGINESIAHYPKFILNNIFQHFKLNDSFKPFEAIRECQPNIYYLYNYISEGYSFTSDIAIKSLDCCVVDFSVRRPVEYQKQYPEQVLETIGILHQFEWKNTTSQNIGRFEHRIVGSFLEFESKAIKFITEFLSLLIKYETQIANNLNLYKSLDIENN